MLEGLLLERKMISFDNCIAQLFFLHLFVCSENFLLTIMDYDHYGAICALLRYPNVMNIRSVCSSCLLSGWGVLFTLWRRPSWWFVYLTEAPTFLIATSAMCPLSSSWCAQICTSWECSLCLRLEPSPTPVSRLWSPLTRSSWFLFKNSQLRGARKPCLPAQPTSWWLASSLDHVSSSTLGETPDSPWTKWCLSSTRRSPLS